MDARIALRQTRHQAFHQVPMLAPDPYFGGQPSRDPAGGSRVRRRFAVPSFWLAMAGGVLLVALGWARAGSLPGSRGFLSARRR
ncbi:MAG: hypothetical protein ABIX28_10525 [Vicinamibacterales bacterium]